jgi:hypothetical protein
MKNPFFPILQIDRGRVESVGAALHLYRFPKLRFDLVLCFKWENPRICITLYKKNFPTHLMDESMNHCPQCGNNVEAPTDWQKPVVFCKDCGLYYDLRDFVKLN